MPGKKQRFSMLTIVMALGLFHTSSCSLYNEISPSPDTPHSEIIMGVKKNDQSEVPSNSSENEFQTFQSTGEALCIDEEGRPVIGGLYVSGDAVAPSLGSHANILRDLTWAFTGAFMASDSILEFLQTNA